MEKALIRPVPSESYPPTILHVRVNGKPAGKARPRFFVAGGHVHAYTPKKTSDYEAEIRDAFLKAYGNEKIIDEKAIRVSMTAVFEPSKSLSKAKRAALIGKPYLGKPDADNICKCLDALNGIAWTDDRQIAEMQIRKMYGEQSYLEIEITVIDD
ncbi:MAG: RusA family crossover junction endodeoxyribonuclease [Bulleidia sp.]|nr:RusA family crossover junction endodeoxyribonuclease [Bulleidia sp.]